VLFYVYPLKFVFTMLFDQMTGHTIGASFHEVSVLMRIYAAGFSAVCVLFALMYIHAYRFRRELELNAVEELETRKEMQANMILASAGIISFLLAIRHPELAGWWFFILGPVLGVHGAIYGSRVRMLAKQMGIE
jgi:protein-S-isoprenylcysteine O-methyltransferase Ste14